MTVPHDFSEISTRTELDAARYHRAVRAYAGALLRDDDHADGVSQEVVCELHRGGHYLRWLDYVRRRADEQATLPFRQFLKVAVYRAAMDGLRGRGRAGARPHGGLDLNQVEGTAPPPHDQADQVWEAECRRADRDLRRGAVERAWRRLEEGEKKSGGPGYATLLRLRIDAPEATTEQLADAYLGRSGRAVVADTVRVWLSRAREKFAALLMDEIRPLLPADLAADLAADLVSRESARQEIKHLRLAGFFTDPAVLADGPNDPGAAGEDS